MELSGSFIAGVDALGSALLHFVWQGLAVALVYAALRPLCVNVSARYRLGMGMLITLALCPLITLFYVWPSDPSAPSATAAALSPLFGGNIDAVTADAAATWELRAYLPALVGLWILGVVAIASRSLWHWRRLVRLVHGASAPGAEWQQVLDRMCKRFGLLRPVRLLVSAKVATPMLIGWIKPVVLLPLSMLSGFSPHQIELIIAHELGHVRRWDYLANLFQVALETVLFYHPAVHWISRDVRNSRENCCDDLVLSLAKGNPIAYARALADLEELRHDLDVVVAPALAASGGVLLARIRRIVGVEGYDPLPRNATLPLLVAAAALVFFAIRPQQPLPDLAAALVRLPADGLALMSGNPRLAIAPYQAPRLAMPMPDLSVQPVESDAATISSADAAGAAQVHIALERPRIAGFAMTPAAPVRDLVATQALPAGTPPLDAAVTADAPTRIHVVAPVYPPNAMASGVEGNVELEYSIGNDGGVQNIRVLRAQPAGVFDAAAQTALSLWQFAQPGDAAAGARYVQNFAFTLHRKAHNDTPKCQQVLGSLVCRHLDE